VGNIGVGWSGPRTTALGILLLWTPLAKKVEAGMKSGGIGALRSPTCRQRRLMIAASHAVLLWSAVIWCWKPVNHRIGQCLAIMAPGSACGGGRYLADPQPRRQLGRSRA